MKRNCKPIAATLLLLCGSAIAQPAKNDPPASPPKPPPATEPAMPSLDDLLKTKPTAPAAAPTPAPGMPPPADAATGPAADPSKTDLDRRLRDEKDGDPFGEAITLMADAAERLSKHQDTGIDTQRVQEDVVRKLDQMISQAKKQKKDKQQQQQQKNQQKKEQQEQDQQPQPQQSQPKDGQQNQEQRSQSGENRANLPAARAPQLRPGLDAARAAWGNLPGRVRDMLQQGSGDKFSTMYDRLTEEYYRKLAEKKND